MPTSPLSFSDMVTYPTAYAELEKQKRLKFLQNLFLSKNESGTSKGPLGAVLFSGYGQGPSKNSIKPILWSGFCLR